MKQTYNFEQFEPPILNERILQQELKKREERWRTILLAAAGVLFQALFVLLGLLCWDTAPALAFVSICFAVISIAGSGVITIVFAQKGGVNCELISY